MSLVSTFNDRRIQYTVTEDGESEFEFDFPIFEDTDLQVWVNDTELTANGSPGFTVPAADLLDPDGGTLTLTGVATEVGDVVTIIGSTPEKQRTDLSKPANVTPANLDLELGRTIITQQQLRRDYDRTLRVAPTNKGDSFDLPLGQPGRVFRWNDDGDAVVYSDPADLPSDVLVGKNIGDVPEYEEGANGTPVLKGNGGTAPDEVPTNADLILASDKTVNIPTDYATLQDAVDDLSRFRAQQGVIINVNVEAGHALAAGLACQDGDYSHFNITSDDAEVLLATGFTPVAGVDGFSDVQDPVFYIERATGPVISVLVNAEDKDVAGATIQRSRSVISSGAGVKNAGRIGLAARLSSNVYASGCVFSGSGKGNRVASSTYLSAPHSDFSGQKGTATDNASLRVSRGSVVNISANSAQTPANLSGSANDGLAVFRSFVAAGFVNVSNCSGRGINGELGGTISAPNANADSSGRAARAINGVVCCVDDATLTNSSTQAIFASRGAKIDAVNADVTGFDSSSGGNNAIEVFGGSIVSANGVTGSPTFNIATNAIDSRGIIFN